jgi:hypothetical protein
LLGFELELEFELSLVFELLFEFGVGLSFDELDELLPPGEVAAPVPPLVEELFVLLLLRAPLVPVLLGTVLLVPELPVGEVLIVPEGSVVP